MLETREELATDEERGRQQLAKTGPFSVLSFCILCFRITARSGARLSLR